MNSFRIALIIAAIALSAQLGPAQAQSAQPYGLRTFGGFRAMMMQADLAPKAELDKATADGATDGVGALSEARGEVTIVDGKPIVSYGVTNDHRAAGRETTMLLQTTVVHAWQEIPVTHDVAPDQIEAFLAEQAKARGIDPDKSFAFRARGTLAPYVMHVVAGPAEGMPPFNVKQRKGPEISGLVVGLYAAPELMGIATHMGERTHAHWVSEDRSTTAHLDSWGIKSGAVLLLPKP